MVKLAIDKTSSVPIFRQIVEQIRDQVSSGILKPGERLPGVRDLGKKLKLNQNTTLKIYRVLVKDKVLEMGVGRGTYVRGTSKRILKRDRKKIVKRLATDLAVKAVDFDFTITEVRTMVQEEYRKRKKAKGRR
jgi:GntR family transcriptional regulator